MKQAEGFFAGKKAFDLIARHVCASDKKSPVEIVYNGFPINLDNMLSESAVIGIGEPYATIAKQMSEHFSGDNA